jgi:hypothetical protein
MQIKIDGVDGQRLRQHRDHLADDALESVIRHRPPGRTVRPNQRDERMAGLDVLEEAAERQASLGEPGEQRVARDERRAIAMFGEIGEVRAMRDEAVRFVAEATNRNPRHKVSLLGRQTRCKLGPVNIIVLDNAFIRI